MTSNDQLSLIKIGMFLAEYMDDLPTTLDDVTTALRDIYGIDPQGLRYDQILGQIVEYEFLHTEVDGAKIH